jgi:hypothetical protein
MNFYPWPFVDGQVIALPDLLASLQTIHYCPLFFEIQLNCITVQGQHTKTHTKPYTYKEDTNTAVQFNIH